MIEKVLAIMNVPTNSAMPANTSRKMLKNWMPCCTEEASSLASCSPVSASYRPPSAAST